jgi:nitrate/nitrite transporter NarK
MSSRLSTHDGSMTSGPARRRTMTDRILKYLLDPRRVSHKYLLQFLLCLFLSGPTFFDNFFNACATDIMQNMEMTHEDFSLLVSIPSITGIFCGAVAGMVSAYGSTLTALVTAVVAFIGEVVVAYGIENSSFSTVMTGRIIFVLSWNLLGSVQKVIIFRQFTGQALAIIFALKIIAIRIGAVSGLYFAGTILTEAGGSLSTAMFYAVILSGVSLVCTIAFAYLYRGSSTARLIRPLMIGHRRNRNNISSDQSSTALSLNISRDTWICCGIIFLYYGGLVPFETFGVDYLVTEYKITRSEAGHALALIPFFSFFSFMISPLITNVRRQLYGVIIATLLVASSIGFEMVGAPYSPNLYLCLIGIGHMVVANAVWLALAGVSPTESQKTNAASISSAIYAVSTFTFNWMTGRVRDMTGSYDLALSVLSGLITAASFLAVYLQGWGRWSDIPSVQEQLLMEDEISPQSRDEVHQHNPVIDDNHFVPERN